MESSPAIDLVVITSKVPIIRTSNARYIPAALKADMHSSWLRKGFKLYTRIVLIPTTGKYILNKREKILMHNLAFASL